MAHALAIVFQILSMICSAYACCLTDLCSIYSNMPNITTSHTSCLSKTSAALPEADQATIIDNHNRVRHDITDATNMMKLTWDEKLADIAQRLADSCTGGHDADKDRYLYGHYTVGQNVASGTDVQTWNDAMNEWENEKNDWSYEQGSVNGKPVGHYTQMIWATTVKIGCGYKLCNNVPHYVCNYGPAGNNGNKPYVNGTSASECQTNYGTNGRLCDCGGKVCRNTGILSPASCNCTCPLRDFYKEDDCEIKCDTATDNEDCGKPGWTVDKCVVKSNMPPVYCPNFCGICPAISNFIEDQDR